MVFRSGYPLDPDAFRKDDFEAAQQFQVVGLEDERETSEAVNSQFLSDAQPVVDLRQNEQPSSTKIGLNREEHQLAGTSSEHLPLLVQPSHLQNKVLKVSQISSIPRSRVQPTPTKPTLRNNKKAFGNLNLYSNETNIGRC